MVHPLRCFPFAVLGALMAGCAFFAPELPPYRLLSVEIHKGAAPPHHAAVGLACRFVNTAERSMAGLRTAFWVFGPEDAPYPSPGRNYIQADVEVTVGPGEEVEICTSLDAIFYYVPEGEIQITNFRIAEVVFEDGSRWSDPFSRFSYPGPIPNVEVTP